MCLYYIVGIYLGSFQLHWSMDKHPGLRPAYLCCFLQWWHLILFGWSLASCLANGWSLGSEHWPMYNVWYFPSLKTVYLCEKLTKLPETQTCSVTYNKAMYQVSVEFVKGYGRKKVWKTTGGTDRQTANLQVPSSFTKKLCSRSLVNGGAVRISRSLFTPGIFWGIWVKPGYFHVERLCNNALVLPS